MRFAGLAYEPNERLLDWLRARVEESDVQLRLSATATPAVLAELRIDEVVVATGARRDIEQLGFAPGDNVVTVIWKPTTSETAGDPFFGLASQPTVGASAITM